MFDSPLSASAYEVLGVAPTADEAELRRAYRVQLRRTHPDTGGDAAVFIQVQRAWELVGTPALRAAYDRGHGFAADAHWDGWQAPDTRGDTRPRARSYGQPAGWPRRRYRELVIEWAGEVDDPYDPAFVRTLPRSIRRLLASALAEEETAGTIAGLGMGYTAWHDVATADAVSDAAHRLAHVVLGPVGLAGVTSADFGGIVGFRGGEIVGSGVGPSAPVTTLLGQLRAVARTSGVRFGMGVVVLPDDDLAQAVASLGVVRGTPVVVVRRSALAGLLRDGLPGTRRVGGPEAFDVRTRLQQTVRFA